MVKVRPVAQSINSAEVQIGLIQRDGAPEKLRTLQDHELAVFKNKVRNFVEEVESKPERDGNNRDAIEVLMAISKEEQRRTDKNEA